MRVLVVLLSASLLLSSCNAVSATKQRESVAYPREMQGVWDLGPESCKLPVNPDSDSPIRIEKTRLRGYEHEQTPVSIKLVSEQPRAWVVSSTSDIAENIKTYDVYILNEDYLVISDGGSVRQYLRCK